MTIIFKAKTNDGYSIKSTAEILSNNIKTACFEISTEKISLCMMDHHRITLIDLDLFAENFSIYKYKGSEPLFIGLNLNHFYKMLKTIKKKDSIQLEINDTNKNELIIKVIPREKSRVTTSYLKIQNIQNLSIQTPTGYFNPVIVNSTEFQKMCKDITSMGQNVNIFARKFYIKFCCNSGEILKRDVEFGENCNSDSDEEDNDQKYYYCNEFTTDQLARINKISALSTNIQIFPVDGLPLLFRSNIGLLGKMSIYIKSKSQIQNEKQINYSDSE